MTPVQAWVLMAAIGIVLDIWNIAWAFGDIQRARRSNGSVLRPARLALAHHNVFIELVKLVAQAGFLYVGIQLWGIKSEWTDIAVAILLGASGFTINALSAAYVRIRLDRLRAVIEREIGETK